MQVLISPSVKTFLQNHEERLSKSMELTDKANKLNTLCIKAIKSGSEAEGLVVKKKEEQE